MSIKATLLLALVALCGCTGGKSPATVTEPVTPAADPSMLALPAIPDSITEAPERAAYALLHFWDSLDFERDSRSLDTAFIEQTFVNYLSLLPHATEGGAVEAVDTLIRRTSRSAAPFSLMRYVIDRYLDDPESPMRNESLYLLFLRSLTHCTALAPAEAEAVRVKIDIAMKNAPGTTAADVDMLTRDGRTTSLRRELSDSVTLVMFYDSDCENCARIATGLAQAPAATGLRVIAVDVAGNQQQWERKYTSLPRWWIVGFATEPIEELDKYIFRALPTFYLLDASGIVLLKDPPAQQLLM